MRQLLLLLLVGFCITFTSCRNDFEFETSGGGLEFSRDTVYLDTVFTNIGSSTYTLKVYNRSNKDVKIPNIRLKKPGSKYRLMVDGMAGQQFENVELLAKDSMYVFVETTAGVADSNPTDFLYTDEIEFTSSNGVQEVHLVTLIQDAYFLYPRRNSDGTYEGVPYNDETTIYGFFLDENDPNNGNEYYWKNDKPYVIYGYAAVPDGKTLTVDPGARVHFHADSGLMVRPGGKLEINGAQSTSAALENEVIFEGDRLEPAYANVAGQWGAVLLMSNADNTINHLTLKNANIGIYAMTTGENDPQPKLTIKNSQIYNCTNYGMAGIHANITGENFVANNAGQAAVVFALGGTYNFKYSTFANYFNSYEQVPLALSDGQQSGDTLFVSDLTANFDNCIVFGSGNISLSLGREAEDSDGLTYHIKFNNSLIKLIDSNQLTNNKLYPFSGNNSQFAEYTAGCKIIRSATATIDRPKFVNPSNNNLRLITGTEGNGPEGTADPAVTTIPNTDLAGTPRNTTAPDMGAYESTAE